MRIKRFVGKKVNGYLDFDISFTNNVTFITGVNGTGKTTALKCIMAIFSLDFDFLFTRDFESLYVEFVLNKKSEHIKLDSSTEKENLHFFSSSLVGDAINTVIDYSTKNTEKHNYKKNGQSHVFECTKSEKELFVLIKDLTPPMFLSLDRKFLSLEDDMQDMSPLDRRRTLARIHWRRTLARKKFARENKTPLEDALVHAREYFRKADKKGRQARRKFDQNLIMLLLESPSIEIGEIKRVSNAEISAAKENLGKLPKLLNIDEKWLTKQVKPIIDAAESIAASSEKEVVSTKTELVSHQIQRLNKISNLVNEFEEKQSEIMKRIKSFTDAMDGFVGDSGKTIQFNEYGEIYFHVNGESDRGREIDNLSSGEIQLLVILTHLYFNEDVRKTNVFLIDEPELSLHIEWQEKFVNSILSAESDTQFILATHAPAIILDKTDWCQEIGRS